MFPASLTAVVGPNGCGKSNICDAIIWVLGENRATHIRGETMEEVVGRRLAMTEFTLAVAESCTGGLIAQRLTSVPGSSKYFIEGAVTYSNESKIRLLGVDKKLIREFGAVSQQVARDMARGVRHRAKTDFGLAVTGIAGPGGGTEEKPVGLVFIALADDAHRHRLHAPRREPDRKSTRLNSSHER